LSNSSILESMIYSDIITKHNFWCGKSIISHYYKTYNKFTNTKAFFWSEKVIYFIYNIIKFPELFQYFGLNDLQWYDCTTWILGVRETSIVRHNYETFELPICYALKRFWRSVKCLLLYLQYNNIVLSSFSILQSLIYSDISWHNIFFGCGRSQIGHYQKL